MMTLKFFRMGMVVLQCLWWVTSHAQAPGGPAIRDEISKQEGIFQSQGKTVPEGYVINRSLSSYSDALSAEFSRSLAKLGPEDRWLDIGAGEGQAVLDYCMPNNESTGPAEQQRRGKKARAVAMSIEDRRTPLWNRSAASLEASQLQYLFGKRLREYSLEDLGRFEVITDVIGGFSYTENLALFMEKVLGFLALNGSFFTLLQDVHSENGTNRPYYAGAPFLTEIANADGSELKVCSWLKSITCVEVACELKAGWIPPIEVFHVRKVCNNVSVPVLVPVHYAAGTPPERRFQSRGPSRATPSPAAEKRTP